MRLGIRCRRPMIRVHVDFRYRASDRYVDEGVVVGSVRADALSGPKAPSVEKRPRTETGKFQMIDNELVWVGLEQETERGCVITVLPEVNTPKRP